jgi:hypothetical protein
MFVDFYKQYRMSSHFPNPDVSNHRWYLCAKNSAEKSSNYQCSRIDPIDALLYTPPIDINPVLIPVKKWVPEVLDKAVLSLTILTSPTIQN